MLEINDADPKKSLDTFKKMLTDKGLPLTEENIFIAAACQEKGILFLEGKAQLGIRKNVPAKAAPAASGARPAGYTVTVNGKAFAVELKGDKALVNGKEYAVNVADGLTAAPSASAPASAGGKETEVKASVPGVILRISVSEGVTVAEGDELLVMDVMKMETPVASPCAGTVKAIHVAQTDKVNTGDALVVLG